MTSARISALAAELVAESRGEPAVVAERIGLAGLETRLIAAELLQDFLEVMRGIDLQRRRGGFGDLVYRFLVNVGLVSLSVH